MEVWKDIVEFEGLYQVSNIGRVKSMSKTWNTGIGIRVKDETIMTPVDVRGYLRVHLCKSGIVKRFSVHRLVGMAFYPEYEWDAVINHKDGDKTNNHISNLEWCTYSENTQHAIKTGLQVIKKGKENHMYGKTGPQCQNSKPVVNTLTGEQYASAKIAASAIGMNKSTLVNMLNGYSTNKTNLKYVNN